MASNNNSNDSAVARRESIRQEVRSCIREELQGYNTQSLVNRTRTLIQGSASFAAQNLTSQVQASPTPIAPTVKLQIGKGKRPLPGHPLRFSKEKRLNKSELPIPKSVYLLEEPDIDEDDEYSLTDSMIILKGECDLYASADETAIRAELVKLFKSKLPFITNKDFDFVRRERNTISKPLVKADHIWDFKHVKHLCGTGRLYVRLNVAKSTLIDVEDNDDNEHDDDDDVQPSSIKPATPPHTNTSLTKPNDDDGSSPSGTVVVSQKVDILSGMFPTIPQDIVRNAVMTSANLNTAVNVLLQYDSINAIEVQSNTVTLSQTKPHQPKNKHETLPQILQRLRLNMQPRGTREKLKVEQDDMVTDVYSYYKSSDFDPTVAIFVSLKGQPAIDTGGVLRQVFSDVFYNIANNDGFKNVFSGNEYKVPVFSNELVVNGFFEILGKMIAHSLVQSGPGFPYLSPAIYWYLATGDLQIAIQKASCSDVDNRELADYISRVNVVFWLLIFTVQSTVL